jgi:hypothetical protein
MCQSPLLRIHLHQRRAKPESGPSPPTHAAGDALAESVKDREDFAGAGVDDTPQQRFMAATKDVQPDEPIDTEQAIALLVKHGFPDGQIHAIVARCERSAAQRACARRLMTKIDNLVDRQSRIPREQSDQIAAPLSSQQASSDSREKAREGSGKTWLIALAVVAGGIVAAVAA